MAVQRSLKWGAVAFGVVLALIVGVRLEQAALTVLVGLACGVGASIPTSILLVALMRKQSDRRAEKRRRMVPQAPQVVVVTPHAAPHALQPGSQPEAFTLPVPGQREFSIIGEDEITDL
jgi:hypothetical protein